MDYASHMTGAEASSGEARFRYSVWPGVRLEPPAIPTWRAEHRGGGWFVLGERGPDVRPPHDLHVVEFGRTDFRDPAAVAGFIATSGLPAPHVGTPGGPQSWWHDLYLDWTAGLGPDLDSVYARIVAGAAERWHLPAPDLDARPRDAVHHAEVVVRVESVATALTLLLALSDDRAGETVGVNRALQINAGLARFAVRVDPAGGQATAAQHFSAYEAACLLIANDLAEHAPYRRCANETCRRIFSRQRGRAEYGQHRSTGVTFCTPGCARAQSQRERRRKARDERKA